jgi:hypothetical protein
LKINSPNDKYEQEADKVAEQVMRMPEQTVQRKCAKCNEEDEMIQTKSQGDSGKIATSGLMNQIQNTKGNGQMMDANTRSFMEPRFGMDFSKVKIHSDNRAAGMSQGINAKAFTVGQDIYFNNGAYSPGSVDGKKLLAHELTHVMQQQGRHTTIQREESEMVFTTTEAELALAENRTESVDHQERRIQVSIALQRAINFLQAAINGPFTIGPDYELVIRERIYIGGPQDAAHPVTFERNVQGETWEERNSRLSILVTKLRELYAITSTQPLPEHWYPDNNSQDHISEDPLWNDTLTFYSRYAIEQEPQNLIHQANLFYIDISDFRLNSSTNVGRRSHPTGINLVVPDPDHNPYNYHILRSQSPVQGLIMEVRREGDIYFYMYRGNEIFLPGDPFSIEETTEQRRDPLTEGILEDLE